MRWKITVIGSDEVALSAAQRISQSGCGDVTLLGDEPGAEDLDLAALAANDEGRVCAARDRAEAAGSSVVVLAQGAAEAAAWVVEHSPRAVLVVAEAPVREVCERVLEVTQLPRARVLGAAGPVAAARVRAGAAAGTRAPARDVTALVVGDPDGELAPISASVTVAGAPLEVELPERVSEAGAGTSARAAAAAALATGVIAEGGRVLPCAVYCRGEYGVEDRVAVVPVRLGLQGVEEILEVPLRAEERSALEP
jgi:malate dehydrogenase